jgi:hypothetical protein
VTTILTLLATALRALAAWLAAAGDAIERETAHRRAAAAYRPAHRTPAGVAASWSPLDERVRAALAPTWYALLAEYRGIGAAA